MDRNKRARTELRKSFTRILGTISTELRAQSPDRNVIEGNYHLLEKKIQELDELDKAIFDYMLDNDGTDEEFERETASVDDYQLKFGKLKSEVATHLKAVTDTDLVHSTATTSTHTQRRKFKLPDIEFKKFSGDIKEWLHFWSLFKKVDEDPEIAPEDKFQYLIQATVTGSRAAELVNSFPPTAENYKKAIESLKTRFGKEDLLIEFYIRELLVLVLKRALKPTDKLTLCSLYDKLESQLRALESLGVTTDKYAAMLYPLVESCMPEELLRAWQRTPVLNDSDPETAPKNRLTRLMKFLNSEVESEERISLAATGFGIGTEANKVRRKKIATPEDPNIPTAASLVNNTVTKSLNCIFCGKMHASTDCIKAQQMSLDEKRNLINGKKGCYFCLRTGHFARRCKTFIKCIVCQERHATLMCPKINNNQGTENKGIDPPVKTNLAANSTDNSDVFLQSLVIRLKNNGKYRYARAVIDSGSQRSYILEKTAKEMHYETNGREKLIHSLFGGMQTQEKQHTRYRPVMSDLDDTYECTFDVLDQDIIVGNVPHIKSGPWLKELQEKNIKLSDVGKLKGPIEILIGADIAGKLSTGKRHVLKCGLVAIETKLGWTLMGKVSNEEIECKTAMLVTSMFVQNAEITNLWKLDVLGIQDPVEKQTKVEKEEEIYNNFLNTTKVNDDGRYEVSLPWIGGRPEISTNQQIAEKRLRTTTRKLHNELCFEAYNQVLNDWQEAGIIEVVEDVTEETKPIHYLPHRPVVKENSTTRIRPVFDASARTNSSLSLNQCLETGPNLIELIPAVLLRFRLYKIGVISDIKGAFLQISLNAHDRDYLRFLWWNNSAQSNIKTFRHTRVVFGLSCSPFLLASVIKYHLENALKSLDNGVDKTVYSRETVIKLLKGFYVDNCVTSVRDKQELDSFISEARGLMQNAHMDLRGWEHTLLNDCDDTSVTSSVLGIKWNRRTDVLSINLNYADCFVERVTKRTILSIAHKLYDPIGFLCPITVQPKILLQKTWSLQTGWDVPVPEDIKTDFLSWFNELRHLESIEIPRWFRTHTGQREKWSVHTFCDASKDAYAASIFLRVESEDGITVQLVQAKSRITPSKNKISTPRLELLAATVGARLANEVKKILNDDNIQYTFWSDSTTVLAWIQNEEQWGVFVNNRVREIRKLTGTKTWRHVAGDLNPADLPSRGCNAKQLNTSRWWEGPAWLRWHENKWPVSNYECDETEVDKERRKVVKSLCATKEEDEWYLRFSNYDSLLRVQAWTLRFINNCRKPVNDRNLQELTVQELNEAEKHLVKEIQKTENNFLDKRYKSLHIIRDEENISRLKTKIINRNDNENFRLPMVLPSNHPIVRLLVMHVHEKNGHCGTQLLMNILRENFWVLGGRKMIRSVLKRCVKCLRYESKHLEAEEGPLPINRVRNAKIFEICGTDFAGPLYLKDGKKAWVCVFTCAIYRAVHLELVSSLSTDMFMLALRRFIDRRGRPRTVFSDNGTNFHGTVNLLKTVDWEKIKKFSNAQRIEWRFNPPSAAWWGGWWERMIRILKNLLKRILGKASLWYEELLTILCDCEAIMNSRPITYLSDGDSEVLPLTPAMFLQEIEEIGVPDLDATDSMSLNKRIRYRQKLRQDLRQRFRSEYLGQLVHQVHNKKKTREVEVGEVVLVGNDLQKRIDWPLAQVKEILTGRDGVNRVVRLKQPRENLYAPYKDFIR